MEIRHEVISRQCLKSVAKNIPIHSVNFTVRQGFLSAPGNASADSTEMGVFYGANILQGKPERQKYTQVHLGDTAGWVPEHRQESKCCNTVNHTVSGFLAHIKVMFTLYCGLLSVH